MTEVWVVPELQTNFTENFSIMLLDYIYDNWSYTAETGLLEGLNKPAEKTGQSNYIEFRAGVKDIFKTLQVLTRQGRTVVVKHSVDGSWKRELMTTQVWVTTLIRVAEIDDSTPLLRMLDQEIGRLCGMYQQSNQTGDMSGIKDLIYEGNDPIFGAKDEWNKSDWGSNHSILLFYELAHGEQ